MQDNNVNVNDGTRSAPWSGMEILIGAYLVMYFWPITVSLVLKGVGVEHWYYDDNAPEMAMRLELWVRTFALPFQALTVPLLFSAFSHTRLDQLGLTTARFGRNVLLGLASWLALVPPVFGIFLLLRYLDSQSGEQAVEKHALEQLAQLHLFLAEWIMLFFTAMVSAPLLEELLFRGVLQPWLAARRWGGHAAMLGALALAIGYRGERMRTAWLEGIVPLATAAAPALFVLALLPIYLLMCRRGRTPLAPAIFATSLLFACTHAGVWPTPIPLFVLALGLGVLAVRTRGLVGPIVLHSLFNGISCVQLLIEKYS
ncbi:MAG: CPBP family intramembrane glutamic endopeptidase [Gemmataceae bacterium]